MPPITALTELELLSKKVVYESLLSLVSNVIGGPEVAMYNPQFLKTIEMVETIHRAHVGEILQTKLTWAELKDGAGDVYQIVPLLDIQFKF